MILERSRVPKNANWYMGYPFKNLHISVMFATFEFQSITMPFYIDLKKLLSWRFMAWMDSEGLNGIESIDFWG